MRSRLYPLLSLLLCLACIPAFAQQEWPKVIRTSTGTEVRVFEFQPQSLAGNNLKLQAAVSLKETGSADPVFGMLWADALINKDQYGNISSLNSFAIQTIKIPGVTDEADVAELKDLIESELPKHSLNMTVSELQAQLSRTQQQTKLSGGINTRAPKIIYSKKPGILVYIDGQPQIQSNPDWKVDQVVNTPFTIIKSNEQFFLYGNKKWFTANSITGPWNYINQVPNSLAAVDKEVRRADTSVNADNTIPEVFVTTEPAELLQSKGEPNFAAVESTNLLYMTNTNNDIFLDINTQQYYVLISGRWYKAQNLAGNWTFISADNLPEDFARIPEGSTKDAVLASIAGTPAAEESLLEAQIPQTAKVDRNTATAQVDYDGEPQFENIEGTDLEYAVNTAGTVINDGRKYYLVENGVWFESNNANGPWKVATERPDEVANIPASSPVYNVKYVYIYDATPEYVYMGYTPGYLGTYIYGPTVVYGTGYRYRPWRGRYYYARPVTWGFNMRYNPWLGWTFGISYGRGWFYSEYDSYSYYNRPYYGGCWGGWWGPTVYRPQYSRNYGNYYGRNTYVNNIYINRSSRANNVYRYRRDVVTYDRQRNEGSRYGRNTGGNYAGNNDRDNGRPGRNENVSQRPNDNQNTTPRNTRFGGSRRLEGGNNNSPVNDRISSTNPPNTTTTGGRFGNRNRQTGPGSIMNSNGNSGRGLEPVSENTNGNSANNGTDTRRSRSEGRRFGTENQPAEVQGNRNSDFNTQSQGGNANAGQRVERTRVENPTGPNPQVNNNGNFERPRESNRRSSTPDRVSSDNGNFNRGDNQPAPSAQPQRVYTPERRESSGGNEQGASRQAQRREMSMEQAPSRPSQQQVERRSEPAPSRSSQPQVERRSEPAPSSNAPASESGTRRSRNNF